MRLIPKLVKAQLFRRWLRTLLVLAALITSVAMVVVVVGAQDISLAQSGVAARKASGALGKFDAIVVSGSASEVEANRRQFSARPPMPGMKKEMLDWLRSNKNVQSLLECTEMGVEACPIGQVFKEAAYKPGQLLNSSLLATECPDPPYEMLLGTWVAGSASGAATQPGAQVAASQPGTATLDRQLPEIVIDASQVARLVPSQDAQGQGQPGQGAGRGGMGGPGGAGMGAESSTPPPADTIGKTFQIITSTGRHEVRVRGVIKTPYAGRNLVGMYVSPETFEQLTGNKHAVNRVIVDLKNADAPGSEKYEEFVDDFTEELAEASSQLDQPVDAETVKDIQAEAGGRGGMGGRGGGGGFFPLFQNASRNLAILAAMFIIFSTLNMGLQERSRQLAMLRAIGMTRGQVVILIASEVLVLAVIGWLAGVAVGWWTVKNTIAKMPALAGQNVSLNVGLWLGLGAITSFGATFAATIVPAFLASRRRPLEGMEGSPVLRSSRPPLWTTPVGLVLIASLPFVSWCRAIPENVSVILVPISLLACIVGFALVMPILVVICERLFARPAALIFWLNHRLLSKQLSAGLWRTVGSATALMVGLGLFVTVQVWGQSMLRPFLITQRSPDAIVTLKPYGIPLDKIDQVRKIAGVQRVVPMILQYPEITNIPADVKIGGVFSREAIYVGCDVRELIDEKTGIIEATFVRGNAKDAFASLADGNSCIITDGLYLRAPGQFDVGKTIALDASVGGAVKSVEHTIAGVIEMPGWQLLTKSTQMRQGMERVGALVIVPEAAAVRIYPGAKYKTCWFMLAQGTQASSLELPMIRIVDPNAKLLATSRPTSRPASRPTSMPGGQGDASEEGFVSAGPGIGGGGMQGEGPGMGGPGGGQGGEVMQAGGQQGMGGGRRGGRGRGGAGGGRGGMGGGPGMGGGMGGGGAAAIDSQYYARVTDSRAMTAAIRARADGIIEGMTVYPMYALALSALAVVGTMISSVRVRTWEIGVLRSIGLTRWQLVRQVFAEGLLIGLLACVVSLLFGMLAAWAGLYASTRMWGVSAPFVFPWKNILLGIGATVALCLLASIVPALTASLRSPMRLLQEGRTTE